MTHPPTSTELPDPLADLDGDGLACLGLRRANGFMDVFVDLNRRAHEEWVASLPKPSKPRKRRKPKFVDVAKQASEAAITVARYEVKPDGTVVVVVGKPEAAAPDNPWPLDEFRTKETKQ